MAFVGNTAVHVYVRLHSLCRLISTALCPFVALVGAW